MQMGSGRSLENGMADAQNGDLGSVLSSVAGLFPLEIAAPSGQSITLAFSQPAQGDRIVPDRAARNRDINNQASRLAREEINASARIRRRAEAQGFVQGEVIDLTGDDDAEIELITPAAARTRAGTFFRSR